MFQQHMTAMSSKKIWATKIIGFFGAVQHFFRRNTVRKSKKNITLPTNDKDLIELFYLSHDIFRHKYSFNSSDILNYVYDFIEGNKNKQSFIKKIRSLKIPNKFKNQLKFKSQNIFK